MPQGDKSSYTEKQKRKAEHIEEGYIDKGVSEDEAEARAWATVNKQDGGGKKKEGGKKKQADSAKKSDAARARPSAHGALRRRRASSLNERSGGASGERKTPEKQTSRAPARHAGASR